MNRNMIRKAVLAAVSAFAILGSGAQTFADAAEPAAQGSSNQVSNGTFTNGLAAWAVGNNTQFEKIGGVARILNISKSPKSSVAMVSQCVYLPYNYDFDLTMRAWFTPGERDGKFVVRANFFSELGCEGGALEGIDLFQTSANGWQQIDVPVKQWYNPTEPRSVLLTLRVQKYSTEDPKLIEATRSAMVDDIVIKATLRTNQNPTVGEPAVPVNPVGSAEEPAAEEPTAPAPPAPPSGGPVTLVPPSPTAVPPSNPQPGSDETPPAGGAGGPSSQPGNPSAGQDGSGTGDAGQNGGVTTGGNPQAKPTLFPQDPPLPQEAPPTLFPQDPPLPSSATPTPPPPATGGDHPLNPAEDLRDDPAAGGSVTAFATTDESLPLLLVTTVVLALAGVGTALGLFFKRARR